MQTILLTGASRGLGRAIAETFLGHGDRVVATARDPRSVAGLEAAYPGGAHALALDVTDAAAAERAVVEAISALGVPDVLVTNAGYADIASIEDSTLESMRSVVETNLWGVVHLVKAVLPHWRAAGHGRLIHISSVSGRLAPVPGLGAYVTAKFAAEGFVEALALEMRSFGIKATIVEPGRMATSIGASMVVPEATAPYARLIAPLADAYANGAARGTPPEMAAALIRRVAGMDEPPLRLALGSGAFDVIRAADRRRLAELDRHEALSRSVDHELEVRAS